MFAAEKVVAPTWLNDRDQFLQPNAELSEEFKNDCLVYMLFNGSNLTASANGLEWNGQKWNLVLLTFSWFLINKISEKCL
ncbi:hypothetical protein [Fibrobacter sp.]|uniref:hypothetical protein n=1 Tax=Fibrobacter sp. TaxID=35828 RepID=UPI0025BD3A1F|nr:hypothetical protein [Fibrobacter sp.]MCI6436524.1 hypothetical protein [Fibrobacter sp.]